VIEDVGPDDKVHFLTCELCGEPCLLWDDDPPILCEWCEDKLKGSPEA